MAQFLRPDGVISQGSWTGDHTAIDEVTPDDVDRVYSQNNPNGSIFEVSLSNPDTPDAGATTVRYRYAQVNNGTPDGTGTATSLNAIVVQGTTIIATDATPAPVGTWTTRTWAPDLSAITDWTDVRLRFTASGGGGSPANRRGMGVSWAEIEVPNAPAAVVHGTTGALGSGPASVTGSADRSPAAVTHVASGVLTGSGSSVTGTATRFRAFDASGVLSGQGSAVTGSADRTRAFDTSGALTGQGSAITGAADRTRAFDTAGNLVSGAALVAGSSERTGAATTHATSGNLSGGSAVIDGTAQRSNGAVSHDATGAISGAGSSVTGTSERHRVLSASGNLVGGGSSVSGNAARAGGPVTHSVSGAMVGGGSLVGGVAARFRSHTAASVIVGAGSAVSGSGAINATSAAAKVVTRVSAKARIGKGREMNNRVASANDIRRIAKANKSAMISGVS